MSREFLIRFLAGIATSFVGMILAWLFHGIRKRYALWSMEGLWLEVIQDKPLRYSLGELRFSYFRGRHFYKNKNYSRDDVPQIDFQWQSINSAIDANHSHFMYISEVEDLKRDRRSHGFGFIHLPDAGTVIGRGDTVGYFADAEDKPQESSSPLLNVLHWHNVRCYGAEVVAKELKLKLTPEDTRSRERFIRALLDRNWNGN